MKRNELFAYGNLVKLTLQEDIGYFEPIGNDSVAPLGQWNDFYFVNKNQSF